MAKQIILKPVITEKSAQLSGESNRYTFVVEPTASKHQIRSAVEEMFDVKVSAVNTLRVAARTRRRFTRGGVIKGGKSGYKKAIVTLGEGQTIDFYGDL